MVALIDQDLPYQLIPNYCTNYLDVQKIFHNKSFSIHQNICIKVVSYDFCDFDVESININ